MVHCVLHPVVHYVLHPVGHCVLHPLVHCVLHPVVDCVLHPVVHCVLYPVVHCVPCSVLAVHVHCRVHLKAHRLNPICRPQCGCWRHFAGCRASCEEEKALMLLMPHS